MIGLWLENKILHLRDDLVIPSPQNDEALIKVRLAGICSTDLEMVKGYYPFRGIPGHEFVGEVIDSPGAPELLNQRVVGEINLVCHTCTACKAGRPYHCENRKVLGILGKDGVFAELITLPVANLHLIPDSVPDEAAVFIEPLAAALEITSQVHINSELRVVLVGAGRLGQLIARVLQYTGCDLRVVVRSDKQRQLLNKLNIICIQPDEIAVGWADICVEASGSVEGFMLARKAVRPNGVLILKSTYAGDIQINLSSIVVDEITLIGSRCGPFQPAIRYVENKMIDPTDLIDREYPLSKAIQAYQYATQRGALKVLLRP